MDKAMAISKVISRAGIISSVGYQERYNPEIDHMRNFMKDKKIGLVNGRWLGDMPQVHWWRNKEASGGQIVEQSTHIIDMLRFLFGEVKMLYCSGMKGLIQDVPNYTVEDGSSTILTFESGLVATLLTGCYLKSSLDFNGVGLQIICQDAVIDYEWNKEVIYTSLDGKNKVENKADSHLKATQIFIEALRTNKPELIKSSYADACKTLEITLAANRSMETKEVVYLNKHIL
jgi:predicted dehydrogenase